MDFTKIGQAAAIAEDLNENQSFTRELPKEGIATLRLLGYVELGRQEATNSTFKPSLKCILTFELNHPKHLVEYDGKKTPQQFKVYLHKTGKNTTKYKKVFLQMNKACGGKFSQFIEMIGQPFLAEIFHNKSEDGKTTYANLDEHGSFSFNAPLTIDPITEEKTPIQIAELHGKPFGFLWNNAELDKEESGSMIKAMWESIYIDGTYEKDGKEISKNWMQESIMNNLEFEGSVTQALVQEHIDLGDGTEETTEASPKDLPEL